MHISENQNSETTWLKLSVIFAIINVLVSKEVDYE